MITEELYINGVLVPLEAPNSIASTYQANSIGEIQNRQNDFTNVFNVVKNSVSRQLFENSDIVNSASTVPYRKLTARYVVDGIETLSEGIATLVRSTQKYYQVKVVSGNANYFKALPDMKVSELLGSELSHVNSFENIVNSRSNTSGYIYPLINWMRAGIDTQFSTEEVDVKNLLPCIFVKDVFEAVDNYTGFDSYGALKGLPDFDNLILTPNALERSTASIEANGASADVVNEQTFNVGSVYPGTDGIYAPVMDNETGGFSSSTYTATEYLYGYFTFKGQIEITYRQHPTTTRILTAQARLVRVSDNVVIELEQFLVLPIVDDPSESYISIEKPFSLISENIALSPGDSYRVELRVIDSYDSSVVVQTFCKALFKLEGGLPYNSAMPVAELYEGLTVKQLLQDVLNMYASTPLTNSLQRRIRFGLFNELEANKSIAKDWTSKINGTDYELEYIYGKYGQTNTMTYKPDSTVPLGYGDSSFNIDDENLAELVNAVALNVSATVEESKFQGQNYPRIESLDLDRSFEATNYRILLLNRQDTNYSHTFTDGVDSEAINDSIPYATFEPLKFDNLKANYYSVLLSILTRSKIPSYTVKLTPQDIQELDYLTPIYLDIHTGDLDATGYFYINQVANYVNGSATVLLARL